MIKYKANAAKKDSIFGNSFSCSGKLLDLASESTFLINRVYCAMAKDNEVAAETYRQLVIRTISKDGSPIWNRYGSEEDKNAHS